MGSWIVSHLWYRRAACLDNKRHNDNDPLSTRFRVISGLFPGYLVVQGISQRIYCPVGDFFINLLSHEDTVIKQPASAVSAHEWCWKGERHGFMSWFSHFETWEWSMNFISWIQGRKDIKVDLPKLSCDILGERWTGRQGFSCICHSWFVLLNEELFRSPESGILKNHKTCPSGSLNFWMGEGEGFDPQLPLSLESKWSF